MDRLLDKGSDINANERQNSYVDADVVELHDLHPDLFNQLSFQLADSPISTDNFIQEIPQEEQRAVEEFSILPTIQRNIGHNNPVQLPTFAISINDVILKMQKSTKEELDRALKRIRAYEETYKADIKPHNLSPLGPRKLVQARWEMIVPHLNDARIYPKKLWLVQEADKSKRVFDRNIPYARWPYARPDFRKNVIHVYNGEDKLVSTVFNPKEMWDAWNNKECFSQQHWDCIKSNSKNVNPAKKRKLTNEFVDETGILKQHDDNRVFRGWKNSIVVIGGISCAWDALIPAYLREPNCVNTIPEQLTLREDLSDTDFGPYSINLLQSLKDREDSVVHHKTAILESVMSMNIHELKLVKNMCEIVLRQRNTLRDNNNYAAYGPTTTRSSQNSLKRKWRSSIGNRGAFD